MTTQLESLFSPPNYYVSSPFDSAVVDNNTEITAITVLGVFGVLFLAGFLGHSFVLAFVCSRSQCRSPITSAFVILASITVAHLLFVVACLPAAAYVSVMELVTSEWMLSDITCRLVPFIKLFLLGVTTLSYIALSIDRFRSAGFVDREYASHADSKLRRVCKMLVLWIGAFLLATPELLIMKTNTVAAPLSQESNLPFVSNVSALPPNVFPITKHQYDDYRRFFEESSDLALRSEQASEKRKQLLDMLEKSKSYTAAGQNTTLYVQYDVCTVASSWDESFPHIVRYFMVKYFEFRHWWLLVFYFFFPICFALLFALLISRRLALSVQSAGNEILAPFSGSYYLAGGNDSGTLTSQREPEQVSLMDAAQYKTNSLLSNQTNTSDALYQQRGYSFERHVAHVHQPRRLSPVMSTEDLHDASPTVVVSNGSIRTVDSSRRLPELSPQSPFAPSLACTSGVSVLSLAMSNTGANGGGIAGTTSLPPHGHRRSIKRNSRSSKLTARYVYHERAFNSVLVALILAFTLTQLPLRVVSILLSETSVLSMLEKSYAELIVVLCNYIANITFIINPIVLCFSYKLYRRFLANWCCCC